MGRRRIGRGGFVVRRGWALFCLVVSKSWAESKREDLDKFPVSAKGVQYHIN